MVRLRNKVEAGVAGAVCVRGEEEAVREACRRENAGQQQCGLVHLHSSPGR